MNIVGITGMGAAAILLLVTIALGGPPERFANPLSAILVTGIVLGLQLRNLAKINLPSLC